jgi:hypothetical protein
MAEGKEGPFLSGAQRVVMHVGAAMRDSFFSTSL